MTDLLITVLISGFAVTYTVEFLDLITIEFFGKNNLYKWLSLPLSFCALCSLEHLSIKLVALTPAAAFISLAISKYLNKPVLVNNFNRLTRGL